VSTNGFGMPVDEATNGLGIPVTQVTAFGMPVIYVTGGNPIISPVLTLTSPTTDNTPDFTLTGDLAAADVVRFQYANNSSFTGATDITHTITAPEDAANSFSFSTGALADGTWWFRARVERPVIGNSGWSNTVTETIAAVTLDAATTAWVNAVVTAGGTVSSTQQGRVDTLIRGLKTDGLFALMDRMWLFAGESNVFQARIDIINLQSHVQHGTPTSFTVAGYKGDGVSFYLDSGFKPSTAGHVWGLDSASIGWYDQSTVRTGLNMGSFDAADNEMYARYSGGSPLVEINGSATGNLSGTTTDGSGFWVGTRTAHTTVTAYHNGGSSLGTDTAASSALEVSPFFIFARDSGSPDNFSSSQLSMVFVGGGLNATQATNLSTRVNAYMTSWGVNLY
jgi:hypothetical protein